MHPEAATGKIEKLNIRTAEEMTKAYSIGQLSSPGENSSNRRKRSLERSFSNDQSDSGVASHQIEAKSPARPISICNNHARIIVGICLSVLSKFREKTTNYFLSSQFGAFVGKSTMPSNVAPSQSSDTIREKKINFWGKAIQNRRKKVDKMTKSSSGKDTSDSGKASPQIETSSPTKNT